MNRAPRPIRDEDDVIIMTLKLASGRFESTIQVPLFADAESKQRFVESWLNLMQAGLNCGKKDDPSP